MDKTKRMEAIITLDFCILFPDFVTQKICIL